MFYRMKPIHPECLPHITPTRPPLTSRAVHLINTEVMVLLGAVKTEPPELSGAKRVACYASSKNACNEAVESYRTHRAVGCRTRASETAIKLVLNAIPKGWTPNSCRRVSWLVIRKASRSGS